MRGDAETWSSVESGRIGEVRTYADLRELTHDAPVVLIDLDPEEPVRAWRRGDATAFVRVAQSGQKDLTGLGPANDLGPLLSTLMTASRSTAGLLDGVVSVTVEQHNAGLWERGSVPAGTKGDMWRTMSAGLGAVSAPQVPHDLELVCLDVADDDAASVVQQFLERHHTTRWSGPRRMSGPAFDERWLGLQAATPKAMDPSTATVSRDAVTTADPLLGVGCVAPTPAGVPHGRCRRQSLSPGAGARRRARRATRRRGVHPGRPTGARGG